MATRSRYCRLFINEFDFSGTHNNMSFTIDGNREDVTPFQATAKASIATDTEATLEHGGFFTAATDSTIEYELQGALGTTTSTVAAIFDTSDALPSAYVIPTAASTNISITTPVDGVMAIDGSWSGDGWKRGALAYRGTLSGTGGQTSVDIASAGSSGGVAYVFIQTITGTATSATIDIESSSDDAAFASEGTATFSAVGVQTVTLSGTVNRYLRANCTSLGGATSFLVAVVVCVDGVTTP